MKKILSILGLFITLCSHSATAVDGWYSSVFGGAAYLPNNLYETVNGQILKQAHYESGYDVGGRFGYQSHPMRYEGELSYFKANLTRYQINGVPQTGVQGYNNAFTAMANIYYDFPGLLPCIQPFLGVGLGYAFVNGQFISTGPAVGPLFTTYTKYTESDSALAYQGTAGLTYNFSENYALNVAYKYLATNTIPHFGKSFQAQAANVGVVYRFDEITYK